MPCWHCHPIRAIATTGYPIHLCGVCLSGQHDGNSTSQPVEPLGFPTWGYVLWLAVSDNAGIPPQPMHKLAGTRPYGMMSGGVVQGRISVAFRRTRPRSCATDGYQRVPSTHLRGIIPISTVASRFVSLPTTLIRPLTVTQFHASTLLIICTLLNEQLSKILERDHTPLVCPWPLVSNSSKTFERF
jgi:hypothetical protein